MKLNIKKGNLSVTQIFFFLAIGIFLFGAFFNFVVFNGEESGKTINGNYTQSYHLVNDTQTRVDNHVKSMRDQITNIEESEAGYFNFNGLKFLLTLIRLPLDMLSYIFIPIQLISTWMIGLPTLVIVALTSFITIAIVFAVFKLLTNRVTDP